MSTTTPPITPGSPGNPGGDSKPPQRHPFLELLQRYRSVVQAAWAHRHELAGPARMADEAAFLPAALSLQATPPHPAPRRALWAIMALFTIALLWACIGQVDIVAVAPGRIVVSDGTKLIQPLEASVVKAIHVKDGDKVQAGQVLIELDPTSAQADNSRVSQERSGALSEAWRTQALLTALRERGTKAPVLPEEARQASNALSPDERELMRSQLDAEWRDTQAQLARLQADIDTRQAELQTVKEQIEKLQATLPIVRKREDDFQTLQAQGFVSQHAGQDRTQARIEMERDLATQRARLVEVKAAIAQAEHNHAAWRTEALKTLSERHAKADLQARSLQAEGTKTGQREQLTTLRAPVSGTVQQRAVHTTGGVVTPAQVLMVVVPDAAQVTAEVTLENKDVGFVHLGQEAAIKLETFPFTRYGTVEAKVTTITADAVMKEPSVQPGKDGKAVASGGAVFPATLTLAAHAIDVDGKAIRLAPGMNLTAEIKTGKRRVIEYLLSPVQSHVSESLKER
ncbi:HlyD family type I secretion periplasmic adaptor subunit [Aquabacterium parvum]|uniref:HlyD family type I secretion periplasmic adaptor subunit n=1 Tax=Aquabacterium parvum TaxID=70584 RepID=UPI000718C523|nr:HlyD family type I secretion periplasmic adaptor subunit [Aquabacterium parvum]MBU0915438.1 HlyD family type I secretion periplasmic adaptor subunit [Gammaproteobacteria bacterium]